MKFSWLMIVWIFLMPIARAGNELGNGGDSYAQEFTALGRKLVDSLRAAPEPRLADPAALSDAVEQTRVTSAAKLELRGAEVDAINYPAQGMIEVNRARWKEYDVRQKASLVLHEYLGMAGIGDENYQISGAFFELPALAVPGGSGPAGRAGSASSESHARLSSADVRAPKRFSLGLGSGVYWFGGNAGLLFGAAGTPIELKGTYLVDPMFNLRFSAGQQNYAFTTMETGGVEGTLRNFSAGLELHPFSGKQWNGQPGWDLYSAVLIGQTFREQNFSALKTVMKDTALNAFLGLGVNYFFGASAALGLEGRIGSILFKDRFEETYATSGIYDTTGPLYAANASLQFFF